MPTPGCLWVDDDRVWWIDAEGIKRGFTYSGWNSWSEPGITPGCIWIQGAAIYWSGNDYRYARGGVTTGLDASQTTGLSPGCIYIPSASNEMKTNIYYVDSDGDLRRTTGTEAS